MIVLGQCHFSQTEITIFSQFLHNIKSINKDITIALDGCTESMAISINFELIKDSIFTSPLSHNKLPTVINILSTKVR
jgi:hypothetical protein